MQYRKTRHVVSVYQIAGSPSFQNLKNGFVKYNGSSLMDSNFYKYLAIEIQGPAEGTILSGTIHVTMKIYPKFCF